MSEGLGIGRRKLVEKIITENWECDPSKKQFNFTEVLYVIQELLQEEGRKYLEGGARVGKLEVFRGFVKHLLYRNLANYDSMILLSAEKGVGKSSAAIMMAREWMRLQGRRFDPARHIAYNNADVMNKIDMLDKFEVIIADEAVRFASACVDGDTKIKTPDGYIQIRDLAGFKNFEVISFNEQTKQEETQIAQECVYVGLKEVYEIKLNNNKIIRATAEHKFLTINGWKTLSDLAISDILIPNMSIKYIWKLSERNVYDIINVSNTNNYIGNGFIVHNSDWARRENKELKKKLAQVRTKHLLYILCFPLKVYKLEKNYLESFVNYWCLTGDTRITTKDKNGLIRQTPIKNVNNFFAKEVLTYNINENKYEFKKYEKKIKRKKDAEIYEMELNNGLKIKCTKEHLFLTQRGYVRLDELRDDDKIEVKTRICKGCKKEFVPSKQPMIWCSKNCKSLTPEYKEKFYAYQKDYIKKNYKILQKNNRERYLKNREKHLEYARKQREEKREHYRIYSVNRRKNNPEYVRKLERVWRAKNRDYILRNVRKKFKERYKNDVVFKLKFMLGRQLKQKLKVKKIRKSNNALKYLGCSVEEFKIYLENKFKDGMSWLNHTPKGWHIDHIKPISKFNLYNEDEIKKCFHYTNMQPLWWYENLQKHNKYIGDD